MLRSLFPRAHQKYFTMSVLGPIADSFDDWLIANGYTPRSREDAIRTLLLLDADLRRRQIRDVCNLNHLVLHDCWRALIKTCSGRAGVVRTLERFLATKGVITDGRLASEMSPASILIEEYANYLREVCGLKVRHRFDHRYTATVLSPAPE